jgi:hypothetical protein
MLGDHLRDLDAQLGRGIIGQPQQRNLRAQSGGEALALFGFLCAVLGQLLSGIGRLIS